MTRREKVTVSLPKETELSENILVGNILSIDNYLRSNANRGGN
jgi:hypothetical protein